MNYHGVYAKIRVAAERVYKEKKKALSIPAPALHHVTIDVTIFNRGLDSQSWNDSKSESYAFQIDQASWYLRVEGHILANLYWLRTSHLSLAT